MTSIGPLASRPGAPAGRRARAHEARSAASAAGSTSLRLFQDSFNPDSFGLYTRLGYAVADVAPYLLAEKLEPAPAGDRRRHGSPDGARRSRGRRTLRSARARAPTAAAISRCSPRRAAGFIYQAEARGGAGRGYLLFRALPARVVIGPAVAESAEMMAALVDGVAALCLAEPP